MSYVGVIVGLAAVLGGVALFGLLKPGKGGEPPLVDVGVLFGWLKKRRKAPPPPQGPRREPVFGGAGGEGDAAPAAPKAEALANLPDLPEPNQDLIATDVSYVIRLYCENEKPFEFFHPLIINLGFPTIRAFAFEEDKGEWRLPAEKSRARYWMLALPLVDRGGIMTRERILLIEGDTKQFLAPEAGVVAKFSNAGASLELAQKLAPLFDAINKSLEWRINFDADDDGVGRATEAIGMDRRIVRVEKSKHEYRQDSEALFAVIYKPLSGLSSKSIGVFLDPPLLSDPPRAFGQMLEYARRLADVLGGVITDSRGQSLDEERIADIAQQLDELCQTMRGYGVPPGSEMAKFLFGD